jgi:hypothetical protein
VSPLHYISLIKAHQLVGFFLNSALRQFRKANYIISVLKNNCTKYSEFIGTHLALMLFPTRFVPKLLRFILFLCTSYVSKIIIKLIKFENKTI